MSQVPPEQQSYNNKKVKLIKQRARLLTIITKNEITMERSYY